MKYTDRAIEGMMMIDVLTSQIDLNILIEPLQKKKSKRERQITNKSLKGGRLVSRLRDGSFQVLLGLRTALN